MAVATYTKTGAKATSPAKLDKTVFGVVPKNHQLLKAAYVAYLANGRTSAAKTKKRGEVSGGGRKPWRQKGTGRARFGSSRNPIWRGGGVAFGPTGEENYSHKLPVSAKRLAIRQALSVAADSNKLVVIEAMSISNFKTAEVVKLLKKIGADGQVLLVLDNRNPELDKAMRNIPEVKAIEPNYVNVFDVMNADHVVITNEALKKLSEWLGATKNDRFTA